jgi:hypothetical protein
LPHGTCGNILAGIEGITMSTAGMKPEWFWVELGFDPNQPLPAMTTASIRAARDKRLAKLKLAGARTADIARLHFAFEEAKRYASDR